MKYVNRETVNSEINEVPVVMLSVMYENWKNLQF